MLDRAYRQAKRAGATVYVFATYVRIVARFDDRLARLSAPLYYAVQPDGTITRYVRNYVEGDWSTSSL